ncbi:MAG: helix-turn-helix transcriptional regulator [Chitinophagaceae bacterium]|nr:helix-turn-helix transcriptional regulator [Chitinophagaceae bacterium]
MKSLYRKNIARRLTELRETNKKKQEEVAVSIGMKRPAYAAYEEGRAEPSIVTLRNICRLYKITVDSFLEGID